MYTDTTPNYNLPVFLGTDRPTWQDIGTGNTLIDTALKDNADKIAVVEGAGNGNTAAIDTLRRTVTSMNDALTKAQNDIIDNTNDILANEQNITKLQGDYAGVSGAVGGLETRVTAAEGQINTLNSTVSTNTSNINKLTDEHFKFVAISESDSNNIIQFSVKTENQSNVYLSGIIKLIASNPIGSGMISFPTQIALCNPTRITNLKFPLFHYDSENVFQMAGLASFSHGYDANEKNLVITITIENKATHPNSVLFDGVMLVK